MSSSQFIDDVVISTDDHDISEYAASRWEVLIRMRPKELCNDDVTLDPVVCDAVEYAESKTGHTYDIVVTLQPTTPTLQTSTLDHAIDSFINSIYDTMIAVVEDTHLRWEFINGVPVPTYRQRVNRQWLPKNYKESGAFVISKRQVVNPESRFGNRISIYPLSQEEGIDIDDEIDWLFAETLLARLRIAFVVNGNQQVGMGHIYRALALADIFFGNQIRFFTYASDRNAVQVIENRGYEIHVLSQSRDVIEHIYKFQPDIVINDVLDTAVEYITTLRSKGFFVVNFEDLGKGSLHANLVFNALYEFSSPPSHHRFGAKYVCLGEHFLLLPPAPFRDPATTLLITFGGVDENNLTLRTCEILPKLFHETTLQQAIVILGPNYAHHKELTLFLENIEGDLRSRIQVYDTVENMARLIRKADVGVTSNGRTVYELAAMGVPGVSIAQNDRETLHLFSRYSEGFQYLGIASNVDGRKIAKAVGAIVMDRELRLKMVRALFEVNLRSGINRVRREILDEYWRWRDEDDQNWTSLAHKG